MLILIIAVVEILLSLFATFICVIFADEFLSSISVDTWMTIIIVAFFVAAECWLYDTVRTRSYFRAAFCWALAYYSTGMFYASLHTIPPVWRSVLFTVSLFIGQSFPVYAALVTREKASSHAVAALVGFVVGIPAIIAGFYMSWS